MSRIPGLSFSLKLARISAGLTVQQVADAVGVSQQAISKWEREVGGAAPKAERLSELAQLYGTTTEELLSKALSIANSNAHLSSGDRYLQTSPLRMPEMSSSEEASAQAYADLFGRYSKLADDSAGLLRVFESVADCAQGMRASLDEYDRSSPSASDALRAYQEFSARLEIVFFYSLGVARKKPISERSLQRADTVAVLNQVVFSAGLQPPPRRPVLAIEHPDQWLKALGLASREQDLEGTEFIFKFGLFDRAELRDERNQLVTFFERRLLSD
ncbi:helix-turn-helix transcriptional regulator [Gemmatimonas sp.]